MALYVLLCCVYTLSMPTHVTSIAPGNNSDPQFTMAGDILFDPSKHVDLIHLEKESRGPRYEAPVLNTLEVSGQLVEGYQKGEFVVDEQTNEYAGEISEIDSRLTRLENMSPYVESTKRKEIRRDIKNLEKRKKKLNSGYEVAIASREQRATLKTKYLKSTDEVVEQMQENPVFAAHTVLRARVITAQMLSSLISGKVENIPDASLQSLFPELATRFDTDDLRKFLVHRDINLQSMFNTVKTIRDSRNETTTKSKLDRVAPLLNVSLDFLRSSKMLYPGYDDDGFLMDTVAFMRDVNALFRKTVGRDFDHLPSDDHALVMHSMSGDAMKYAKFLAFKDMLLLYGRKVSGRQLAHKNYEQTARMTEDKPSSSVQAVLGKAIVSSLHESAGNFADSVRAVRDTKTDEVPAGALHARRKSRPKPFDWDLKHSRPNRQK